MTGAAGLLGRHVVAALARCGADVKALVRDRSRVPWQVERDAQVDNAVDGILLALATPEAAGQIYNLVDDPQVDLLGGLLESRRERAASEQPADSVVPPRLSRFQVASVTRDVQYDTANARRELGWSPEVPLGEGLRRTFARDS